MVSIDGDRFRLRDWNHVKPTIYTKVLNYQTLNGANTEISTAIIDKDGRLYDTKNQSLGILTVRYSGNLQITTDVSFSRN
ncbi:hypothetical protein WMW72_01200 [Paenibacillus filicis]|uniref:Uncharacterized protein n=1 Tax=Paenibacillus filicis TaxID=669464 RepID=A0ABU9DFJ4_9BACL